MTDINVVKRNGSIEPLDISKIHKIVSWACEGVTGVSASEIEIQANFQLHNKIKTSTIHETLIKSAADLISEDTPNYQWVAARLLNYQLRKEVYGSHEPDPLIDIVRRLVKMKLYDASILSHYTDEEFDTLDSFVDHRRDFTIPYCGMEQLRGKYLIKDRVKNRIYETPQIVNIMIAATLFAGYPKEERMRWVRDYYDAISTFDISLPTPVMSGVRTKVKQYSSCVLISAGDSLDEITAATSAIVKYIAQRAGIGIGASNIRALGSPVRNGDTRHTGVIPFYKLFQSAVKSCSQGSIRGGSGTIYHCLWHLEIEELLVLKNNKGTEESRVRHLDYGIQLNRLMYERLIEDWNITLFSPHDLPEMYEAFFVDNEKFKRLYEAAEKNPRLRKKVVKARDLFSALMHERKNTGRIYIQNVDHCNDHSSFIKEEAPITMSNLCCVAGNTFLTLLNSNNDVTSRSISDIFYESRDKNLQEISFYEYSEESNVFETDYKVRSKNIITNKHDFYPIKSVSLTRRDSAVTQVVTDTGTSVYVTEDHKFWNPVKKEYIEAQSLTTSDYVDDLSLGSVGITSVNKLNERIDFFDLSVKETSNFFANGILVHNSEITLPTRPLKHLTDGATLQKIKVRKELLNEFGEFKENNKSYLPKTKK